MCWRTTSWYLRWKELWKRIILLVTACGYRSTFLYRDRSTFPYRDKSTFPYWDKLTFPYRSTLLLHTLTRNSHLVILVALCLNLPLEEVFSFFFSDCMMCNRPSSWQISILTTHPLSWVKKICARHHVASQWLACLTVIIQWYALGMGSVSQQAKLKKTTKQFSWSGFPSCPALKWVSDKKCPGKVQVACDINHITQRASVQNMAAGTTCPIHLRHGKAPWPTCLVMMSLKLRVVSLSTNGNWVAGALSCQSEHKCTISYNLIGFYKMPGLHRSVWREIHHRGVWGLTVASRDHDSAEGDGFDAAARNYNREKKIALMWL